MLCMQVCSYLLNHLSDRQGGPFHVKRGLPVPERSIAFAFPFSAALVIYIYHLLSKLIESFLSLYDSDCQAI